MQNNIPLIYPADLKLKTVPFKHQREVTELSWHREYYALLMEMGTGKTKVAIDTAAALHHVGEINGLLIFAPKGVYLNWMRQEIPAHMPEQVGYAIAPWKANMSKEEQKRLDLVALKPPARGILDIVVMNIEALNVKRGYELAEKFLQNHTSMCIIDESTCIKGFKAERSRKSWTLGRMAKYRRIMTGTPITQNPLDLFSQFQFLSPGALGFSSYSAFRAYYACMIMACFGNRSFPKITGFRNLEQLQKSLAAISYRKLKTECLDLPPKIYQTRSIEMTEEQAEIYTKFKEEALVRLEDQTLSSTSALTTIMKLQQIACGHVMTDDGTQLLIKNNRVDELMSILDEASGKVIIWCAFQQDVRTLVETIAKQYGDPSVVHYYGETSESDRAIALDRFRKDPECRFWVGTAATGGMGITLIEANTTVYYSNGYNLLYRLQSEDRNHRIGQTQSVTIIDIICENTVDPRIVKLLKAKKDLASLVLDDVKKILQGEEIFDAVIA